MKCSSLLPMIGTLLLCLSLNGQDCSSTDFNDRSIQGNDYKMTLRTNGYHALDNLSYGFLAYDDPDGGWISTLYAQNIWIGGLSSAGDLQLSAGTYNAASGESDFFPGPVLEDGEVTENGCQDYNKIWKVAHFQIEAHLADFADNGVIDDPQPAVIGWPGFQNPNFMEYNGFELADNGNDLAPYFDANEDGRYTPLQGDYPVEPHSQTIAEELSWSVYNTMATSGLSTPDSESVPIEVQQIAWAFHCDDITPLNKTVFLRYQLSYRGEEALTSFRMGIWNDGDIGCLKDDAVGSAPSQNTWFYYNLTNDDIGCEEPLPNLGSNPPVQSITFLNQPLSGFIYNAGSGNSPSPAVTDPDSSEDYYNYLNLKFKDGSSLRADGDGYSEDPSLPTTQFAFSGDPNNPDSWSAFSEGLAGNDRRGLGVAKLDMIEPEGAFTLDIAYTYHREPGNDHLENVTAMYDNVAEVQELYNDGFNQISCSSSTLCDDSIDGDCVWPGDLNADGTANYVDLVAMGFGFDVNGPLRDGPDNWSPRTAQNWNSNQADGVNQKHQDGNGDGIIDYDDFNVTLNHYDETQLGFISPEVVNEGIDLRFGIGGSMNTFYLRDPGAILSGHVRLSTEVELLRAITYEVSFDTAFYDLFNIPDPTNVTLEWNYLREISPGNFEVATYNEISGLPSNENYSLLQFILRLKDQNINDFPAFETFISFKNVRGWQADGTEVELGAQTTTVRFAEAPSAIQEPAWAEAISVFPNPVDDELRFSGVKSEIVTHLEIVDAVGRVVSNQLFTKVLNVNSLAPGTYFLRLVGRDGAATRKFVKL